MFIYFSCDTKISYNRNNSIFCKFVFVPKYSNFSINIQNQKFEKFKALHYTSTPLLLPNVWDVLGASLLEEIGYPAIATSSSAIALTHGYHDGEQIPFEEHLKQVARIAKSVARPVSVDIENGYATTDEELQENISKFIDAGIVGINYEDSDKHTNQLINIEEQSRRIKLIKNTATQMGVSLFVNARIDTYVHGNYTDSDLQLNETLKRAKAYKEAGADCLFPIIIKDYGHISTLVKEAD
ncbi:MAG: isocitrate lyase/phosphoenolpyruvate mutase family protein, partial [Bacteroidetes bacterium]|nr:isocitrate lyase/phosphoenolpyruvate mutase family protein [Bacteroidota bacterium]